MNKIEPHPIKVAHAVVARAKELGPSIGERYGNSLDITLDEDALVDAIVELLEGK
jgi:hypothetical protein